MRPIAHALCLALAATWPHAFAADPPAAPPDELDALALADKAAEATPQEAKKWRVFIEGALVRNTLAGSGEHAGGRRASLDLRFADEITEGVRAVLSNRLDLASGSSKLPAEDVNTLREAYLSWSRNDHQAVNVGRINLRHGMAVGFNPTDWFKQGALRSVTSPDPAVLRENRQGTVVLQGQQLWGTGSLTAAFSPKLGNAPSSDTFALNAGATNPRHRWLLAGSHKLGDALSPQWLVYGGRGLPAQIGLNVSALIGDATVAFGEFAVGKGRSLAAEALGLPEAERRQRRAAVGLTYTTAFDLSLTAEAEYNSAAPDRGMWETLPGVAPAARLRTLAAADAAQDLPVRQAWFFHARWQNFLLHRFDLSAFVRHDAETHSQALWLEARYRWESADLSLQWQRLKGDLGSVYGTLPQRQAVEVVLRLYH